MFQLFLIHFEWDGKMFQTPISMLGVFAQLPIDYIMLHLSCTCCGCSWYPSQCWESSFSMQIGSKFRKQKWSIAQNVLSLSFVPQSFVTLL